MLAAALLRKPASLNKTEGRYWDRLVVAQHRGEIVEFKAHSLTLILGPDCRYTPEFLVVLPSGEMQIHEVKGPFIRSGDDGMVKLRVAARLFPWFRFILAQEQKDKSWEITEVVP